MNNYIKPEIEVIEFNLGDNSLGNLCSAAINTSGGVFGIDEGADGIFG